MHCSVKTKNKNPKNLPTVLQLHKVVVTQYLDRWSLRKRWGLNKIFPFLSGLMVSNIQFCSWQEIGFGKVTVTQSSSSAYLYIWQSDAKALSTKEIIKLFEIVFNLSAFKIVFFFFFNHTLSQHSYLEIWGLFYCVQKTKPFWIPFLKLNEISNFFSK